MRKISFQQQILTGFLLTLLFIFALAIISYFSVKKLQNDSALVSDTQEVISTADRVVEQIFNSESSVRGYIITGIPEYLKPYHESANSIGPAIQQLRQLVKDNPKQVINIDTLAYYASLKLSVMQKTLAIYDEKGFNNAKALIMTNAGKVYMDKIKASADRIRNTETDLLIKRKLQSDKSVNVSIMITLTGLFIILWLILILLYSILRTFKKQKLTEQSVNLANIRLQAISEENVKKNWLLTGAFVVDEAMRGVQDVTTRAKSIINEVAKYVNANMGAIYLADDTGQILSPAGSYAFSNQSNLKVFKLGEGMIGQAALEKRQIIFTNIPEGYFIGSGLGHAAPKAVLVQPFLFQGQLKGVIELAFMHDIPDEVLQFFETSIGSIGIGINAAQARVKMQDLYEQTQQQAEELESQQEELRTTNEELIHKTHELQASEEELRVQQEELRQINSELEEKAELLEEKNKAIEQAREAISLKAVELEQTSKYKSEFLANMSHELRTPLNSILILARILRDNKKSNLNEDQVKYANVIHNAGSDLLTLINDILDLSKIESGKIDLTIEEVKIAEVKHDIELLFREVANIKKIDFSYSIANDIPESIISDRLRLEQILKNLLSNSFKFTPENGKISVTVGFAAPEQHFFSNNLSAKNKPVLAFSVTDSGIGIPPDKQKVIFEAFQQADGSTSRKYGGTGLGLSISRELSFILGGEIGIKSQPGEGSIFTLYLPLSHNEEQLELTNGGIIYAPEAQPKPAQAKAEEIKLLDSEQEQVLLIIEDDINFAELLREYATERGFKPLVAHQGDTGLEMARKYKPNAIVLDIMLPVMDGWTVIKNLKNDPDTRDIPVHLMSAGEEGTAKARLEGAIGFMKKPVDKEKLDEVFNLLITNKQIKLNKVLIVEDTEIQSENLRNQLNLKNIEVRQAFNGAQALKFLEDETGFDCIILDLSLPDISGLDLLDKIKAENALADIPVVINTAMELDQTSIERVMKHTHAMVLKNSKSNDRLLDEVNLFMNKIKTVNEGRAKDKHITLSGNLNNTVTVEKALKNRSVLIVDDDMRNIFALTSALEAYNLQVSIANNGLEALKKLDENPLTDIVLMDIMMPEMDGYEAMREIRKQNRFNKLPIVALTAKAMKNDREKCIEAGANDYISKPVEIEKLVSLMRVWLS